MNATESPEASLHEILNSFRFYLEGVMLMPVSVTGIIGKAKSAVLSLKGFKGLKRPRNLIEIPFSRKHIVHDCVVLPRNAKQF